MSSWTADQWRTIEDQAQEIVDALGQELYAQPFVPDSPQLLDGDEREARALILKIDESASGLAEHANEVAAALEEAERDGD